jgi:polar amino acid transport system substrate-binding protein
MNKKILIALVIILVFICVAYVFSTNNKQAKGLVASGHPAWSPIMYQDNNQIVGAGPEIVKKIFSELGIIVDSRYEGTWDVVQEKARSGVVDVLVAAYKTAERESYMVYSNPYTFDPIVLVVKKGNAFVYDKWEDLISKKGVVTIGDSYGQDFDNFVKEKLTPVKVATPGEAIGLLNKGEADYFVYALYSAQNFISENQLSEQVEIMPKNISSENFYLTISKKSPYVNLMPKVNDLLKKYTEDGTISRIIEQYNKK